MTDYELRRTLIDALEFAEALGSVDSRQRQAFEQGRIDLPLQALELDSLARMEILIALETTHGVVMSPEELLPHRTLGEIASYAARQASVPVRACGNEEATHASPTPAPYIVRLFRRAFRGSRSVGHLRKLLIGLESRATPSELATLAAWHRQQDLLPGATPERFNNVLSDWLNWMERGLAHSGKLAPESFELQRLAPAVRLFRGPGDPRNKTLLICFAGKGARRVMIPNAALLQHTDAQSYDVMVIADPWRTSFRGGVPLIGANAPEVVEWVAAREVVQAYREHRIFGVSAGAQPAVLLAYRLQASVALALAGRLPSERHWRVILRMLSQTWKATRLGRAPRSVFAYPAAKSRDRAFARRLAFITRGNCLALELPDDDSGHMVLEPILSRGGLSQLLEQTVLIATVERLSASKRHSSMRFPPQRFDAESRQGIAGAAPSGAPHVLAD